MLHHADLACKRSLLACEIMQNNTVKRTLAKQGEND